MAALSLPDAGVAPRHAALHIGRRRIRIEAIGDDVGLQRRRLRKGHSCYLQPPVDLVLGAATVRVLQPNWTTPWGGRATRAMLQAVSQRIGTAGIGIVTAIALSLIGGAMALSVKSAKLAAHGGPPTELAASSEARVSPTSADSPVSIVAKEKPTQRPRKEAAARDPDAAKPDSLRTTGEGASSMPTAPAQPPDQPAEPESADFPPRELAAIQYARARYDRTFGQLQSSRQVRPYPSRSRRDAGCGRSTYRTTAYQAYPCKQGSKTVGTDRVDRDRRPEVIRTGMESFLRWRSSSRRNSDGSGSPPSRFDVWPLIAALPPVSLRPAPPPSDFE